MNFRMNLWRNLKYHRIELNTQVYSSLIIQQTYKKQEGKVSFLDWVLM